MTDQEAKLLTNLRKIGVWDMRGGSFEAHFDADGHIVKVDVHRHYRFTKQLSTAEDVRALTDG